MKYLVAQTECASKMFWIVRDSDHSWLYHGPFADETAAHAFARSGNWKALLRAARAAKKARKVAPEEAALAA